jgi:hypothetical protein
MQLEDCPGLVLPLVLERRKDSIPFTEEGVLVWEHDIEMANEGIMSTRSSASCSLSYLGGGSKIDLPLSGGHARLDGGNFTSR